MKCRTEKRLYKILKAVCVIELVNPADVLGSSRIRELVDVRKLFVYFARAIHPSATYAEIGRFLNRHHSTMIHYIDFMNDTMDCYPNEEAVIMWKLERVRELSGNRLLFEIKKEKDTTKDAA